MSCFSISLRFGVSLHLFVTAYQSCIGQREVRNVVLQHQLWLWLWFTPALHQRYASFHLRCARTTPDLEVRNVRNAMLQHQLCLRLQFASLCHYMLELHKTTRGKKCRALGLAFALALVHTSVTPALHQFSPALHQGYARSRGKKCKKCHALALAFALALVYISLSLHARAAQDNAR